MPTSNDSSRSSQKSASLCFALFVAIVLWDQRDGDVSDFVVKGRSCVPDSFSSSESRARDELDAEMGRYNREICCKGTM